MLDFDELENQYERLSFLETENTDQFDDALIAGNLQEHFDLAVSKLNKMSPNKNPDSPYMRQFDEAVGVLQELSDIYIGERS